MNTYHIHINGIVQGVGFRPFVCRLATEMSLNGWVCNGNDGVHIEFNANKESAQRFFNTIVCNPPKNAIVTFHKFQIVGNVEYKDFIIKESDNHAVPDILLTPDMTICEDCLKDISDKNNKRYGYAFTTCLNCGPRYSNTHSLPYDRCNTTMQHLEMCPTCNEEYHDIYDRRHYSQTNSCSNCAIPIHLYSSSDICISNNQDEIIAKIIFELDKGKIIAVKGIGGYLLLCDATYSTAIETLRKRKYRPTKPFALLYPDLKSVSKDVYISQNEQKALANKSAPIVLCNLMPNCGNNIQKQLIAPHLDRIGLMLPYSPLLYLIAKGFQKPMIATSANISGSPIIFKDDEALSNLFDVADFVLTFDREIVTPQDDSVLLLTEKDHQIILRRSRGLAPNYFPTPFSIENKKILAMGGELKSAFALLDNKNLYISQFLGDQASLESQTAFSTTLNHLTGLLKVTPEIIIIDKHPGYFVSQKGIELSSLHHSELFQVQHHKAHFGAVLAENNLLNTTEKVLGIVWDGTGFGDDEQIWGGECFVFSNKQMERSIHLDYFPQLLGDKMSLEPRISALSLLSLVPDHLEYIKIHFTEQEWKYYSKLLDQKSSLQTSSMGRFLDGIASILNSKQICSYEGEAPMLLEALARSCTDKQQGYYSLPIIEGKIKWQNMIPEIIQEIIDNKPANAIALKVFNSLAYCIELISEYTGINQIAFSGGVFQNALLVDTILERLKGSKRLYFHQQLSPNDECIGFGQIACYELSISISLNTL